LKQRKRSKKEKGALIVRKHCCHSFGGLSGKDNEKKNREEKKKGARDNNRRGNQNWAVLDLKKGAGCPKGSTDKVKWQFRTGVRGNGSPSKKLTTEVHGR